MTMANAELVTGAVPILYIFRSISPESHYMLASLFRVNTTHISMGWLRPGVGEGILAAIHVW